MKLMSDALLSKLSIFFSNPGKPWPLCPQRCTEPRHHFPWAPEADPGCHPDPQSPGHPNARPRRAGLTDGPPPRVTLLLQTRALLADGWWAGEEERELSQTEGKIFQLTALLYLLLLPTLPHAFLDSLLPFPYEPPQRRAAFLSRLGDSRGVMSRDVFLCDLYLHFDLQ